MNTIEDIWKHELFKHLKFKQYARMAYTCRYFRDIIMMSDHYNTLYGCYTYGKTYGKKYVV